MAKTTVRGTQITDGTVDLAVDVTGILPPTNGGDVRPCRVAAESGLTYTISSGNVTQINGTSIDGVTVAIGDRVAVLGAPATSGVGSVKSNQPGNGIYTVTGNTTNITLTRAADFSGSVVPWGYSVVIREGTTWGTYAVYFSGSGTFTWGTTALQYLNYFSFSDYLTATQALIGKVITSGKFNQLLDTNGNGILALSPTASAVNYLGTFNTATTNSPGIFSTGSDTNIDLLVAGKGTGVVSIRDTAGTYREAATKQWQINAQTGTTYTFAVSDSNTTVTANNASAQTYTFPQNSSVAIPIGSEGEIIVIGAGQVTFAQGTGATLNSRGSVFKSAGQYAVIGWRKIATNTFVITGDLTA